MELIGLSHYPELDIKQATEQGEQAVDESQLAVRGLGTAGIDWVAELATMDLGANARLALPQNSEVTKGEQL